MLNGLVVGKSTPEQFFFIYIATKTIAGNLKISKKEKILRNREE